MAKDDTKYLQCTEVWGGNECVDRALVMPGLDARIFSKPCDGADRGGDVHYVSSCAAGQISRLLVADVSGHGDMVAKIAGRLRQLMRRHVAAHSQRGLVRAINRAFGAIATDGIFATAVVMTFDSKRKSLLVSNAGHPPPLIYRAATRAWGYLKPPAAQPTGESALEQLSDLPLGIEAVADYAAFETRLDAGDVVICYTDWLPEARNAAGEFLGNDGLLEVARTLDGSETGRILSDLVSRVADWSGSPIARDDVTVLQFCPTPTRRRLAIVDAVLAPVRMARAVTGSYLPSAAHV